MAQTDAGKLSQLSRIARSLEKLGTTPIAGDHSTLAKLDYASAGHTGFLPDSHATGVTAIHGVGASTVASVADIATHAGLSLAAHAATSSAQLAGVLSDETGSGAVVFATSPTLTTPVIGDFTTANHTHATSGAPGGELSGTYALKTHSDSTSGVHGYANLLTHAHTGTTDGAVLTAYGRLAAENVWTVWQDIQRNNQTTTANSAISLRNVTAATSGVPVQMGPRIRWDAHVWDTGASADTASDWSADALPTSGNPPSSTWRLKYRLGIADFADVMTVTSAGVVSALTLTTPTIASFLNANHTHTAAGATGGLLSTASLSDVANVALLNAAQTFTAANLFKPASNSLTTLRVQRSDGTAVACFDTTNGRLGLGIEAPVGVLDLYRAIDGELAFSARNVHNTGTGTYVIFQLVGGTGATPATLQMFELGPAFTTSGKYLQAGALLNATGAGGLTLAASNASGIVYFWGQAAELARLGQTKVLKLAGTAARATTEGTNHLDIFDGTAPVGTLANGVSLYSTAGELRVMDSGGTATLLSPHDDKGQWVFDSVDTVTGQRLKIDVEKMLRKLNDKFGWDFVHETAAA